MPAIDWTRFQKSIFIKADPQTVFNAWVIPRSISTWFLKKADFTDADGEPISELQRITEGSTYAWQWWNYDLTEEGEVLQVDENEKSLEFTFAGGSIVKVWVEQHHDKSLLRLEQSGIAADEQHKFDIFMGCGQGWSFWMVNLKAWLEHGILLNDKDEKIPSSDFEPQEMVNR